jgi:hypothetical protein
MTAFYLTDFLVRQFDAFVTKPLGLDRHPELRDMYFGHYTTLVYQAQTDDPALTEKARACAEVLGLAFERRFTGYGDLETAMNASEPSCPAQARRATDAASASRSHPAKGPSCPSRSCPLCTPREFSARMKRGSAIPFIFPKIRPPEASAPPRGPAPEAALPAPPQWLSRGRSFAIRW